MGSRRKARELALQACYAYEFSGNTPEQVIETVILPNTDNRVTIDFAVKLFRECAQRAEHLDELIKSRSANWEFDRIATIDKLVLRAAICEFLHFEDVPPKVSIDEAIEIAKMYSTDNSGRFVNGILDAVLSDLTKKGLLKKTGRGTEDR